MTRTFQLDKTNKLFGIKVRKLFYTSRQIMFLINYTHNKLVYSDSIIVEPLFIFIIILV